MARMTKKLLAHLRDQTNVCYKKALIKEYPSHFQYLDPKLADEKDMKNYLWAQELPFQSESINNTYLDEMMKLSSSDLELIVEADRKGKFRRAPHTIDAILSELLHRASISETKDTNDGEGKTRRRSGS